MKPTPPDPVRLHASPNQSSSRIVTPEEKILQRLDAIESRLHALETGGMRLGPQSWAPDAKALSQIAKILSEKLTPEKSEVEVRTERFEATGTYGEMCRSCTKLIDVDRNIYDGYCPECWMRFRDFPNPNPEPVDPTNLTLSSGDPVPEDGSHRELDPVTKQQRGYVVLSAEERAKGFVRPVRCYYKHLICGGITRMGLAIAETYAAKPDLYNATFCITCMSHYPVGADGQFVWEGTDIKVGT